MSYVKKYASYFEILRTLYILAFNNGGALLYDCIIRDQMQSSFVWIRIRHECYVLFFTSRTTFKFWIASILYCLISFSNTGVQDSCPETVKKLVCLSKIFGF